MSIQAFARSLNLFVDSFEPAAMAMVARETNRVVRETLAASSPSPSYRFNIGGKFHDTIAPPISALANGAEVIILFDHRREVATKVLQQLVALAPKVSGEYATSFTLFVDGREAPLTSIRADRQVEIVNVAPYARRLEVGRSEDGSPFIVQGPYGLMERGVSKSAAARFAKLSRVRFQYLDTSDPYILKGRLIGSKYVNSYGLERARADSKDRQAGARMRYPSIILGEREYDY